MRPHVINLCVFVSLGTSASVMTKAYAEVLPSVGKPCVIRVEQDSNPYPKALLDMALAKTEHDYGTCRVETTSGLSHARLEAQIQANRIDVGWFNTTNSRETAMLPVRIPLHQGLGGYRILLIRKSDEAKFSGVRDVAGLKQLRAGRVDDELTKAIFQLNKLPTDYSGAHEQLFDMLSHGRVDYLPRSIYKAEIDAKKIQNLPLSIAPGILIHYKSADYFFVNKERKDLADRLRQGLLRGIADGTRDKLRESVLNWSAVLRKLRVQERRVIELDSPELPNETPLNEKNYWIQLKTLNQN